MNPVRYLAAGAARKRLRGEGDGARAAERACERSEADQIGVSRQAPGPPMTARPHPWLAFGLFGLAAGLATVSLLGPLVSGIIEYHVGETLRNQTIGLDAVGLAVVAPLAVVAGRLALRGHAAGPALGLGIGTFTTYMFVQYILGPDYLGLPGNNELLFPLYLALFALGWVVALTAWHALDAERLRRPPNQARLLALSCCRCWPSSRSSATSPRSRTP
jgi:hypothetical protein